MNAARIARQVLLRAAPRLWWWSETRGVYDRRTHRIYLPRALKTRSARYQRYYIAHEMAHWLRGANGHGQAFQRVLHALAPDVHHYERHYKPREYEAFKRRHRR